MEQLTLLPTSVLCFYIEEIDDVVQCTKEDSCILVISSKGKLDSDIEVNVIKSFIDILSGSYKTTRDILFPSMEARWFSATLNILETYLLNMTKK